jgi:hypothetical protein
VDVLDDEIVFEHAGAIVPPHVPPVELAGSGSTEWIEPPAYCRARARHQGRSRAPFRVTGLLGDATEP